MVLVKILGGIDLLSSFVFLMIAFGVHPWIQLVLFCSCLLMLKGLFLFMGEPLSAIDLFASICLLISLLTTLPTLLIWIPVFFLLSKGIVSFL